MDGIVLLLKLVCRARDKSDAHRLGGTDVNIARDFLGIACAFVFRSHRECQNLLDILCLTDVGWQENGADKKQRHERKDFFMLDSSISVH